MRGFCPFIESLFHQIFDASKLYKDILKVIYMNREV